MNVSRAARTARSRRRLALAALLAAAGLLTTHQQALRAATRRPCVIELEAMRTLSPTGDLGLLVPESIAVDHRGNILVADTGNHRIVVVTQDGDLVTEFGGYGWENGQFDTPSDLSVYPGFFTYVLDEGNRRVERFDVDGDYVDRLVDADAAGSPVAVAVGREGGLFILDADSQAVLARSQFNEELDPVGQFGTGAGGLVRPVAVAVGPAGEIGVADPGRAAILVFDEFGSPLYEASMPDTLSPSDLVFTTSGALLVSDARHRRVVAFPPGGGQATAELATEGLRPAALALDGDETALALDSERGEVLFIRIVYGDCGARR